MSGPILRITDGTDYVNLIATRNGFGLVDWTPALPPLKNGGTFVSPPINDGRHLVFYNYANAVETFELRVNGIDQDTVIFYTQKLRRLLEKARAYWVSGWQRDPVYIEARGSTETNTRYAIIHDWSTPNDDNPYAQPFFNCPDALIDGFTLILERGHWLEDAPGSSSCVEVSDAHSYCLPYYVDFTPDENAITVADDAEIQDLPAHANGFTAEAWVRFDGSTQDHLMTKWDQLDAGWHIFFVNGVGLRARVWCATQEAESTADLASFSGDGEWHHVAVQYDDTGDRLVYIYIDGVEATYTAAQQAGTGAYNSDVGEDLYVGALDNSPSQTWDGGIGWVRLTEDILYSAPFTPPLRCGIPPNLTGATKLMLIALNGSGNTILDLSGYGNDGDMSAGGASAGDWGCDCAQYGGHVSVTSSGVVDDPTCEQEVFVGNHRKQAQLTYVYHYDQSTATWSDNLALATPPFSLLPAVLQNSDTLYIGVSTDWLNGGPFSSLVFDITSPLTSGDQTITWQYWNGASFVAFSDIRDNTVGFTVEGVNSIHWEQPDDWEASIVSGGGSADYSAYWVRALVGGVVGLPGPPVQQNRFVYTISWNYITVESDQVTGDLSALGRLKLYNQSSQPGTSRLDFARVICGLRSLSRGSDFTSYLLASETQNPLSIICNDYPGKGTFETDTSKVGGQYLQYSSSDADEDVLFGYFYFPPDAISEYYGKFRLFVIGDHSSDNTRIRVGLYTGTNADANESLKWQSDLLDMDTDILNGIADAGIITIPTVHNLRDDEDVVPFRIGFFATNSEASAATMDVYALVLMPIDEWAGDFFQYITDDAGESVGINEYLDVDSVRFPRTDIRSFSRDSSDRIKQRFVPASNGKFMLQSNVSQRLHFLMLGTTSKGDIPFIPSHEISANFQLFSTDRYLSMRGAR